MHFSSLMFRLHNDIIVESVNSDISVLREVYRKEHRIKFKKRKQSDLSGDL